MTGEAQPYFLIVQIPPAVSEQYLAAAAPLVEAHGGRLLAAVPASGVECLEKGTPEAGMLLAQFDTLADIRKLWESEAHARALELLSGAEGALAIGATGLPFIGMPDALEIPTIASVTPPEGRGPVHYMLIQGTGTDQTRMDRYRDIILPMIKEQGAYYTLFEIGGNVDFLLGGSDYEIFAISRWPDHAAGHAFWDSDRYQNEAIPTRTGAGEFWVHFFEGKPADS